MKVVPLTVETGRKLGSSTSRRMRSEGRIPAVVYGMGSDAVSVTVERSHLRKALSTDAGVNALIELDIDGQKDYTLVKEIQRHPVRRDPIHVDFQRIDPEQPMQLHVPIVLHGDAKKVSSNGGILEHLMPNLVVSVRPDAIPNELAVDVSALEIDQVVTLADIVLPDGVTTDVDPASVIVTALLTRAAMMAQRADAAALAGETTESEFEDEAPSD